MASSSEAPKISDYYCEICKDLWLEPVTLPCQHTMCKECYFQNEAANPLQCPFCKKSVRTWTRKAKKENSYIDSKLWEKTKRLFPDEVTKRLQGESVDIPDKELDFSYVQSRQHYGDGELRKEYEMERQRQNAELERRRQVEEAASTDLLLSLQREEAAAMKEEEERKRQEEEDAKLAALLSSQKSPSKFPLPKRTRSKNKATPPVPKDQPILTAAVLTTPKRKSSASYSGSTNSVPDSPVGAHLVSPSATSPSTSQQSLRRVVNDVNDRLRADSSSPESSLTFDFTSTSHRRTSIKRRRKTDVFDSSDDEDDVDDVCDANHEPTATKAISAEPKSRTEVAEASAGGESSPILKNKTSKKSTMKRAFVFEDSSSEEEEETIDVVASRASKDGTDDGGAELSALEQRPSRDSDDKNNNVIPEVKTKINIRESGPSQSESSRSKEGALFSSHSHSPANRESRDDDQENLVAAQREIEAQLLRAREQEEEDRRMALKLQRFFEKEQKEELTKRPEGYGTRSASSSKSPRPKSSQEGSSSKSTFSTPTIASFSRSRSLTTIDKNASFSSEDERKSSSSSSSTPCPHRASQGSENCSFCILTSAKGGGNAAAASSTPSAGDGKGKGGKGLKRKTSGASTNKSKKRKDTV